MGNLLHRATSPYLLQHRDNPVHWREWNAASLALAQAEDKPILLSIGYAACHWCHVMAHESFEDQATADELNAGFVAIKVDREERPDLDQIYQQALAMLGQQGGWPLTMFLTPAGEPFWGGTYFPAEPRYGRPSFRQVLEQLQRIWRDERATVLGNRDQLMAGLRDLARQEPGDIPPISLALDTARQITRLFDARHGGFQGAPKFPQAPALDLLRRAAVVTGDQLVAARLHHTLGRICQGGIYDHLGGGFARYSTDVFWLVPHFEKMLYDNGQLLGLLAEAWLATGDPLFAARAVETVDWLRREMLTEGAFAASLDADSEGEEGRFYVWSADELRGLLGEDMPSFAAAYGVSEAGNWEGRNVLNRLASPGLAEPATEALLARCRAIALAARDERPRPALDDKILADWNGLMIQGLARAGLVFDRPDWLELATSAFQAVLGHLGKGGRLRHAWRAGRQLEIGFLDDHAQMAAAALALHEATADDRWLDEARRLLDQADEQFATADGGYALAPEGATDLVVRPTGALDGPSPAPVATILGCLATLHALDGAGRWRARGERLLRANAKEMQRAPMAHAAMLSALLAFERPLQIVLIGERDEPALEALRRRALRTPLPHRAVQVVGDGAALPAAHPAHGKQRLHGRPAAYVCHAGTCTPPFADPAELARALRHIALQLGDGTGN